MARQTTRLGGRSPRGCPTPRPRKRGPRGCCALADDRLLLRLGEVRHHVEDVAVWVFDEEGMNHLEALSTVVLMGDLGAGGRDQAVPPSPE
jgi:hypothetical protein